MIKHTFVVCAYKESAYLEKCIESLLGQSIQSNIVVATSTPNNHINDIAKKYNLSVYVNEGEKGIAGDWNFAYSCADTKYITIAHQDDVYKPDYTKMMLKELEDCKKPLIAFSDYGEIKSGKEVASNGLLRIKRILLLPLRPRCMQSKKICKRMVLALGNAICCPSVTFVKDNLPEKLFRTYFRSNVDWEAWEKLSKHDGAFVYCKKILMLHRIHEESETSAVINENKRKDEDYEMFLKFWPKFIAKVLTGQYSKSEKYNNG